MNPINVRRIEHRPYETSKRHLRFSTNAVLFPALGLGLVALAIIPSIDFDRNPLNVREADSESVSTFLDLMKHTETAPWPIVTVIEADRTEAVKRTVEALETVDSTLSVDDFVPDDQEEKLFLIDELALLMGSTLPSKPLTDPPDSAQTKTRLHRLLTVLEEQDALAAADVLRNPLSKLKEVATKLNERLASPAAPELAIILERNLVGTLPQALSRLFATLNTEGVEFDDLPSEIRRRWITADGRHRIEVIPAEFIQDPAAMRRFVDEVRKVLPDSTDSPVNLLESGDAVVRAFQQALVTALVLIALLLYLLLRDVRDVALVLGPLLLAGCYTVACMVLFDIPFNFANVITLPLLLGIGVDNGIHMVRRWRARPTELSTILHTSTARAVVVSALTTICSFGNLAFSPHPGTASMGQVLTLGLAFNLLCHPGDTTESPEMARRRSTEMSDLDRVSLARTFGDDAASYDRARPGYPSPLIERFGALLARRPARIVEVGCGSGKATAAIAPLAFELTAIDISEDLIEIAKGLLGNHRAVRFLHTRFEDAVLESGVYDALVSAQAFHWVDPVTGLKKALQVLRPGGLIALFWNYGCLDQQPRLLRCRDAIMDVAPHFDQWPDSSTAAFNRHADEWLTTLEAQAGLSTCSREDFEWSIDWSPASIVDWLTTHSWWRRLGCEEQNALLPRLSTILSEADSDRPMPFKSLLIYAITC